MTAALLDGRTIASSVLEIVQARAAALHANGVIPCLAFVLVGNSGPARVYASRLERLGGPAGIEVVRRMLPENVSLSGLEREVGALNADSAIDGILVQMPLPERLHQAHLGIIIDPRKDVDGVTIENSGRMYLGLRGHPPSTAAAIMEMLDHAEVGIAGSHAVVVGRSQVVGHPVAELLLNRDATVTIAHRQTRDLAGLTCLADILVVGAGSPALIKPEMVKQGVVIIDAGINMVAGHVVGDVDPACAGRASLLTPVPGGVGPVTNAVLLRGVVGSAEHRDV